MTHVSAWHFENPEDAERVFKELRGELAVMSPIGLYLALVHFPELPLGAAPIPVYWRVNN